MPETINAHPFYGGTFMVDSLCPNPFKRRPAAYTEKALCIRKVLFWWTIKGSNLGPTGYEPAALTN